MTNEIQPEAIDDGVALAPSAQAVAAPPVMAPAAEAPAAETEPEELPMDALVTFQAGVVFATTGQVACSELGADLIQVALTPGVAWRIAVALRELLEYPGLEARLGILSMWQHSEEGAIPHGRIILDETSVQVGIEPLGAGVYVTVGWAYVPGFILALEGACDWAQSVR